MYLTFNFDQNNAITARYQFIRRYLGTILGHSTGGVLHLRCTPVTCYVCLVGGARCSATGDVRFTKKQHTKPRSFHENRLKPSRSKRESPKVETRKNEETLTHFTVPSTPIGQASVDVRNVVSGSGLNQERTALRWARTPHPPLPSQSN